MKQRQDYLDTVAGILVIYMVYGHCAQLTHARELFPYRELQHFLYFFMAWFFFKSGMFHNTQISLFDTFRNSCKRLLIPWGVFILVSHLVGCVFMAIEGDWNWIHWVISPFKGMLLEGSYHWDAPLWFLFSLFLVKMVFHLCQTYIQNRYIKFLIPIMGGAISWCLSEMNLPLPRYCVNVFSGLFFYGVGYYIRDLQYSRYAIVLGSFVYAVSFLYPSMVDVQSNAVIFGSYPLWLVFSIGACITYNNVFKLLSYHRNIIAIIGSDSMFYYVTHWIVLRILTHSFNLLHVDLSPMCSTMALMICTWGILLGCRYTILSKTITAKIGI